MLSCVSGGVCSSMTEWGFIQSRHRARGKAPWVVWLERGNTGGGPRHSITCPPVTPAAPLIQPGRRGSSPGYVPHKYTSISNPPCSDRHALLDGPAPHSPQDGRQDCGPRQPSTKLRMLHPEGRLGMGRRVFRLTACRNFWRCENANAEERRATVR